MLKTESPRRMVMRRLKIMLNGFNNTEPLGVMLGKLKLGLRE